MKEFAQIGGIDQHPWTVEEFIAAAERVMASEQGLFAHPESEVSKELNVRLIRDYVVREIIPRPQRVGREARFGLAHLVQLLAVRQLLRSQKWSLPAIKASFTTTSTEDLLNGVLSPVRPQVEREFRRAAKALGMESRSSVTEALRTPPLNPAQQLIEQFKVKGKAEETPLQFHSLANRGRASPPPEESLRAFASANLEWSLVSAPTSEVKNKLHFEIDRWCEFVIDAQRLKALTPEEIERLGEALKSRLKRETAR